LATDAVSAVSLRLRLRKRLHGSTGHHLPRFGNDGVYSSALC